MNSMLQQLFFQPQLRFALFAAEDRSPDKQKSVLYQVQSLFATLQESQKRFYDPRPLTACYMVDGQPMRTGEQMDADEFFRGLLDKLEFQLKGLPQEKVLDRFFRGSFTYQTISKECEHTSEREEAYYNLQLEIKDKSKLNESLEALVASDLLDGDNKYHCDRCNKKVTALRRCTVGELPNVLVIHLKRFEFDVEYVRRTKVNSYLEFPYELNMEPYTKEGLLRRDQANGNGGELPPPTHPVEFYDYDLTGVIVHTGSTDSGHYYSFIKDPESGNWFCFNDRNVSPFDPQYLPEEAYGGIDTSGKFKMNNGMAAFRPNNAYMLFYQRRQPPVPPVEKPIPLHIKSKALPATLYKEIWEKNERFLLDKVVFDELTMDTTRRFISAVAKSSVGHPPVPDFGDFVRTHAGSMAIVSGLEFFVQVQSHAQNKKPMDDFLKELQSALSKNAPASQWFLDKLGARESQWLGQMLVTCTDLDVQMGMVELVCSAARCLMPYEGPHIGEEEAIDAIEVDGVSPLQPAQLIYQKRKGVAVTSLGRMVDKLLEVLLVANDNLESVAGLATLLKILIVEMEPLRFHLVQRHGVRYLMHVYLGKLSSLAVKQPEPTLSPLVAISCVCDSVPRYIHSSFCAGAEAVGGS